MEEGVYFNMPEQEYYSARGLSVSGMKILRQSPFHYWWQSPMNPARPERDDDTLAKTWGKAFHKIMLEPELFDNTYAVGFDASENPDMLKTVDDMKAYCALNGIQTKGFKKKDDYINAILEFEPAAPIYENLKSSHEALHQGKEFLTASGMDKLKTMARMATMSPNVKKTLEGVESEVSFFIRDPETGIMLKGRMDAIKPGATLDIKSFTNPRCKPVNEAIRDAINYNYYNLQYVVYDFIRQVAHEKIKSGEIIVPDNKKHLFVEPEPAFAFVFTESDAPHYTRIVDMQKGLEGTGNVFFSNAWEGFRKYVHLYKENIERYGKEPWIPVDDYEVLQDEKMPNILYQTY